MITFEPDSPWEVGQVVTFREAGRHPYRKVVVSLDQSEDGSETQYELVDTQWLCRVCQRPCSSSSPFCADCFALLECCSGCDCPKERCDGYGYQRKCCPDCKHSGRVLGEEKP